MQSQNSEVVVRRAIFSDRWKIYQRTLFRVDVLLVYFTLISTIVVPFLIKSLFPSEQQNISAIPAPPISMGLTLFSSLLLVIFAVVSTAYRRYQLTQACHWSNSWIAETNGRLIAVVCIQQEQDYAVVSRLRVDSAYRRRGIGTQLVLTVVEQIPGVLFLKLRTDSPIPEFYRRLEFRYASFQEVPLQLKPSFVLGVLLVRP